MKQVFEHACEECPCVGDVTIVKKSGIWLLEETPKVFDSEESVSACAIRYCPFCGCDLNKETIGSGDITHTIKNLEALVKAMAFSPVESLEYNLIDTDTEYEETVTITYRNEYTKKMNVTAKSELAICKAVIEALY